MFGVVVWLICVWLSVSKLICQFNSRLSLSNIFADQSPEQHDSLTLYVLSGYKTEKLKCPVARLGSFYISEDHSSTPTNIRGIYSCYARRYDQRDEKPKSV